MPQPPFSGLQSLLPGVADRPRFSRSRSRTTVFDDHCPPVALLMPRRFSSAAITPVNWRATGEDIDFCIENAEARAIVYQDASAPALIAAQHAKRLDRIAVAVADLPDVDFASVLDKGGAAAKPRAGR